MDWVVPIAASLLLVTIITLLKAFTRYIDQSRTAPPPTAPLNEERRRPKFSVLDGGKKDDKA